MLVKKDFINITRLTNIEEPATACMWFKMKTQDSLLVMAAWQRQWEHPEIIKHLYTDGVDGEVECINSFQKQIKKAKNISSNIIITGDINIDMLEERDQIAAAGI